MNARRMQDSSYRLLFLQGPEAMLVVSNDGLLMDANSRACSLLGYERQELLNGRFRDVVAPSAPWPLAWHDGISVGDEREIELRMVRRDGIVVAARATVVRCEDQDKAGFLAILFREREAIGETTDRALLLGRAIAKHGSDLYTLRDADDVIRYVSPSVTRVLGYSPEEVVGVHISQLVHPDDATLAARGVMEHALESSLAPSPVRYLRRDGTWAYLESVVCDSIDEPYVRGVMVVSRDVTKRVSGQVETGHTTEELGRRSRPRHLLSMSAVLNETEDVAEMLHASVERFRAVFDQAAIGIALVGTDGRWLLVNRRLCEILGYSEQELLKSTYAEVIHRDERDADHEGVLRPSIAPSGTQPAEARLTRRDGAHVWVNLTASLLPGPSEEAEYLVTFVEDISERKRAEDELRRQTDLYETLLKAQSDVGDGLVIVEDRRISYVNEAFCEICGYGVEELKDLPTFFDLIVPELRATVEARFEPLAYEGRGRGHIETAMLRKDGRSVEIELSLRALQSDTGQRLVGITRETTERKQTEESLRRSLGVLLALREAGQILGSTLKSEEIVTRLLTIMRGVSGLTAAVISVEDEGGQTRIWRAVGLEGLWRKARYAPEAEAARRAVLETGENRLFRLRRPGSESEYLVALCLPLRMRSRIAGVLEAYGPESFAEDEGVEILRSLAAQAASALENATLYGELAEREKRLAELVGQLFTAQEEERRRVAYEVHDGLAQLAAGAHQHLQGFARFYPPESVKGRELLDRALGLVQRTVGEARRVIEHLRPTALDDFGLQTAIRLEVDELRADGWSVEYDCDLADNERIPVAVETALFRIAQEALRNVRRHAGAKRVRLSLLRSAGGVELTVRDWGRGFDPEADQHGSGPGERIGLSSMQERASLLGGDLLVHSSPGVGTRVVANIPLPNESRTTEGTLDVP